MEDTRAGIEQRGGTCHVAQQDLTAPDTGAVVDELADKLGGLGVLVNNAGTGQSEKAGGVAAPPPEGGAADAT